MTFGLCPYIQIKATRRGRLYLYSYVRGQNFLKYNRSLSVERMRRELLSWSL